MARKKFDRSLIPPAPDLSFECSLWADGVEYVAGIDEAGRGALAGPVSAAVVILPPNGDGLAGRLQGVRDSKQMTPSQRESWSTRLPEIALAHSTAFASAGEIDACGILPATRLAIRRALLAIRIPPDHLLIDHLHLKTVPTPQTSLVKGDARSLSIAAASILAKTRRDAHMIQQAARHPGYSFACNKGYGTPAHLAAIQQLGPCPIHRRSFSPLKEPHTLH